MFANPQAMCASVAMTLPKTGSKAFRTVVNYDCCQGFLVNHIEGAGRAGGSVHDVDR